MEHLVGDSTTGLDWDGALDSGNNLSSGSLNVRESFTGAPNEFFAVNGQFLDGSNQPVVIDPFRYTYLDLHVFGACRLKQTEGSEAHS
jgi:hypothetical protein